MPSQFFKRTFTQAHLNIQPQAQPNMQTSVSRELEKKPLCSYSNSVTISSPKAFVQLVQTVERRLDFHTSQPQACRRKRGKLPPATPAAPTDRREEGKRGGAMLIKGSASPHQAMQEGGNVAHEGGEPLFCKNFYFLILRRYVTEWIGVL